MRLQIKLQYKYYEPGEFISIAERTFEETVALILQYPWNEQRHLTSVELTCPSITIRNIKGDYLKLGPGYHQHFNLYLYTYKGKLLKQVVDSIEAAINIVKDFYAGKELEGFYSERFIFNAKKHFETNPFEYRITLKRVLVFSSFNIIFFSVVTLAPWLWATSTVPIEIILVFISIWFLFVGINILLLINYWFYDKKSVIIMSRGYDKFWYGRTTDEMREYDKNDIKTFMTYETPESKIPWSNNIVITLEFNNGEIITMTNLLINSSEIHYKMPEKYSYKRIDKLFPFVRW